MILNIENKVAFIGPLPPPLGGVAVMNEAFQKVLKDTYDVVFFNTSKGNERENLYTANVIKKVLPQLKKMKSFIIFAKDDSYDTANLFITTSIGFIREAFFILILKFFNKKIIIHFHSKKQGEYFLSPSRIRILAYFLNKADKIIVLSDDHYRYFSKYFDKSKMLVIENFVDYKKYECKIENKVKEFLYVGRMSEKKGFFDLLEAITVLKQQGINVKFHILGAPENDRVETKINQYIEEHKITDFLQFHGLKFGKEKYDLFKKCSYFIFPSQFENSPVVLKEAIASKMVIIASDLEANKVVLKPLDEYCTFKMGDPNNLAETIKTIFQDDLRSHAMMNTASKVTQYDKYVAKEKLTAIIEEISEKNVDDCKR